MTCSNFILDRSVNCGSCFEPIKTIGIKGEKYYIDGKYWGEIIEITENYFKVKCNNGNKYLKGRIITVDFNINKL